MLLNESGMASIFLAKGFVVAGRQGLEKTVGSVVTSTRVSGNSSSGRRNNSRIHRHGNRIVHRDGRH